MDPEDRALTEAVVAWLARQKPKARFAQPTPPEPSLEAQPIFFQEDFPMAYPDPAFAEHGWNSPEFLAASPADAARRLA